MFKDIIARIEKRREAFKPILLERFGTENPGMTINPLCSRCTEPYGKHYGTNSHLQCPDEWVAEGHELPIY